LVAAVAMQLRKQRQRRGARLGGARAELAPGVPPAYRVTGIIAKGGSATAYLARHEERGEDCVVKVLDATDPELIAGFAREGALLKRIAHANVVRMHEYGQWQGRHYMALEYVAGGTLKQLMGAPWQGAEAMRVILKVARGLSAVHAAGVVHRDIKPDNILLRFNSLEPVLLDFGTATEQDALAQAGAILGTPSYMAPEVIGGKAALPASDVYACGVMLYELLTGAKPYAAADVTALLALHLEAPVPRLPERDAVFQPLLDRMLAKDPQQRLRDGTEMAAALVKLWHRVKRG